MPEPNVTPDAAASGAWTAVREVILEPPPTRTRLRVTGELQMPTPGYKLHLSKAHPQGINPEILLLTLRRTPPTGIEPQHVVTQHVTYEEHTDVSYQQVQIEPDGVTVNVTTLI